MSWLIVESSLRWNFSINFSTTRQTLSMIKLTGTKQKKHEHVMDYINPWISLSLDYKDCHSKISALEICIQGMHCGHLYIVQGIKLWTFEELAIQAYDMELNIAIHGKTSFFINLIKEKKKFKKGKTSKIQTKIPWKWKQLLWRSHWSKYKWDETLRQYSMKEKCHSTLK